MLKQTPSATNDRTLVQRVGYDAMRAVARLVSVWMFGLRVAGRDHSRVEVSLQRPRLIDQLL